MPNVAHMSPVLSENAGSLSVRVPGTSANLGPGFDALGVALTLYNQFTFTVLPDGESSCTTTGEGADELNQPGESLILHAARRTATVLGRPLPPLSVTVESGIPIKRGMGSSASAVIAGVVAANALLGETLSKDELLPIAVHLEGHADNVTPALFGGFQTAVCTENGVRYCPIPVPSSVLQNLSLIVCVPELRLSTGVARTALPTTVSHADATFNVGRTALLIAALCTGDFACLSEALRDRLHQPYRANLMPGFADAVTDAEIAGAHGVCLSGSGSSILAFAPVGLETRVGQAMVTAWTKHNIAARWLPVNVDTAGTVVMN